MRQLLGSIVFNLYFYISIPFISVIVLILKPILSSRNLHLLSSYWIYSVLFFLKIVCGIKWKIIGKKNIPSEASIFVSNHQGQWESLFLQTLTSPIANIIKKELIFIPFFGWALFCLNPILINRKEKFKSLKKVVNDGLDRLNKNYSVIIFPEGTRVSPKKGIKKFQSSCGLLAIKSNKPIIPIVHNSGSFWINKKFIKNNGEIVIKIGKPIFDKDPKNLTKKAHQWIIENYPV